MAFKFDWNMKRKPGSSHSSCTSAPSDDGLVTTPSHAHSHASTQHSSDNGSDGSRLRLVKSASSFLSRTFTKKQPGGSGSSNDAPVGLETSRSAGGSRRPNNTAHISNRSQDGLRDHAPRAGNQPVAPQGSYTKGHAKGHSRSRGRDEAEEFRHFQESLNAFRIRFGRTRPRRTSDIYAISPCNSYQVIYAADDG